MAARFRVVKYYHLPRLNMIESTRVEVSKNERYCVQRCRPIFLAVHRELKIVGRNADKPPPKVGFDPTDIAGYIHGVEPPTITPCGSVVSQ